MCTLASCLSNELQVDDVTIRAILNHADGSALSHYCFKSFDSLTGPIQAYADWVWNLPGTIPEPEGRLDRPRVWDEDAELMEVPG